MGHVVSIEQLRAMACAVALDQDLHVVAGPPGSGWYIHPETGLIHADSADLERQSADYVMGLICHEASHAAVTRYPHLVPKAVLAQNGIASLMNSLEDCRIEDWLVRRFPGTEPWVDIYNKRLFPLGAKDLGLQPWFRQFCVGAIYEWWHGELPASLHAAPREALIQTAEARQAVVDAQPPIDASVDFERYLAYGSSPVSRLFARKDAFSPPDAFERSVRLSAYEAYQITWRQIRPVYLQLIKADEANSNNMPKLESEFLQQLRALRFGAPLRGGRRRGRRVRIPAHLLPAFMDLPPLDADDSVEPIEELDEATRKELERLVEDRPNNEYDAARRDVAHLADRLVDELERVLRPASYPRWVPGYASGSRVDLRVAMACEVQPGAYTQMWQRKTIPHKRDPAFYLLLDLSGSMRGECIRHGFRGTVLLAEVLYRLNIPFAVAGFQDVVIPFKSFDAPMNDGMRSLLGGMPLEVSGSRRGGHNKPQHNWDGPVLLQAARQLLAYPAAERLLIVVSDGEPSGPSDAEASLRSAVGRVASAGIHLIGIGLGPGTQHVAKYYPEHLANVPLAQFPADLGRLIDRLLLGSMGGVRRATRS